MKTIAVVTGSVILALAGVGALFDWHMWHRRSGRPPVRDHADWW